MCVDRVSVCDVGAWVVRVFKCVCVPVCVGLCVCGADDVRWYVWVEFVVCLLYVCCVYCVCGVSLVCVWGMFAGVLGWCPMCVCEYV